MRRYQVKQNMASCDRYCFNVCATLFPRQFNQCFRDCLACQGRVLSETDEEYCGDDDFDGGNLFD